MTDTFNELHYWKTSLLYGIHGRETKAFILQKLTAAAHLRGIKVPPYNSDEFSEFLRED